MDFIKIIDKYYPEDGELKHILIVHSQSVMLKALQTARLKPLLNINEIFVREAAMVHDIGIVRCNAPSIFCFGQEPYICHGRIGAEMMRAEGYPDHARVCECHTGAGLTKEEIVSQHLPLPIQDFLPETIEEKLICYADKFYSKTHLDCERTVEQVIHSLEKFGTGSVMRFNEWHRLFSVDVLDV